MLLFAVTFVVILAATALMTLGQRLPWPVRHAAGGLLAGWAAGFVIVFVTGILHQWLGTFALPTLSLADEQYTPGFWFPILTTLGGLVAGSLYGARKSLPRK